jgi:hypothetical protein
MIKRSLSTDKLIEKIEDISDEIMTNKELQAKIYTIGAILGNGIRQGIGINTKGGKFKMEDIVGQVIGNVAGRIFGQQPPENQQQQDQGFNPGNIFGK